MKKILLSLLTIAVVSAGAFGATRAFFTDTETNTGNTFSTGTIDIAVDGQNPWSRTTPYQFTDMKPSQIEYANFVIKNVGTNPANVWKKINITNQEDGVISEPECLYGSGTWTNNACNVGGGYQAVNNISSVIRYDLTVWVYDQDPTNPEVLPKWWQVIYTDGMDKRLDTLNNTDVLLGMIPEGWWMKVQQSYHMDDNTGNWAQGDIMTFDITLTAEQLKGTVLLENKDFANQTNPTLVYDDIQGTLTYGVKDSKFNFSFSGKAPLWSTNYSLIFYPEVWSLPVLNAPIWPRQVIVLANALSDGSGNVTIPSTSTELNQNISNMKVWLVKSDDLVGTIPGTQTFKNVWNGNQYLFELGLMDYYDADL